MRIGIDARLWSESGIGRYTRNLILELSRIDKKNEYVLFVLSIDEKEILNQVKNDNFRIAIADIHWHTLEEQLKFPAILSRENLDLVHFPYFSVPIFYSKPYIVTIHDLILHHFPTGLASTHSLPFYGIKLFGYKFVIAQAAKKAKKIIAVSNATKQEIVDHLGIGFGKIVVTYEGIEDSLNSKLPAKQDIFLRDKYKSYFLYVGNAYPHKNLEKLIETFARIKNQASRLDLARRESKIKLILVGREDYFYKRLKNSVQKMELGDQIVFYGQASDSELRKLYKGAFALVSPSFMEGFGLPALEAMANGCIVIASDIPAHREICGDAAIYFNPYDIEDMKEKLEACFNDLNHFSKNIDNGFERSKLFSWEKMAKETLAVYESSSSASSE